jgi:hypothetical protein
MIRDSGREQHRYRNIDLRAPASWRFHRLAEIARYRISRWRAGVCSARGTARALAITRGRLGERARGRSSA